MDLTLWIVTALLALVYVGAGSNKLLRSKEMLLEDPRMGWAQTFSQSAIRLIGLAEVAGAVGLVLPWALGILPVLTPAAGFALAAVMVGAAVVHLRRREFAPAAFVFLLVAATLFVAIARALAL
jgi:uncharacterized membrane protein YphA (DoxX/SURF4 family)